MSNIKIMSEHLANKIAAGEVIEKCASVVKELVENSIDAGSTEIRVSLLDAGIREIAVIDNGAGMNSDDALLAFERHATSKLLTEDDLPFINTLGFRGEALPSIASVSKVTLITSTGEVGTKIVLAGGKLIENTKEQAKKGTSITIEDLFFNTPARLKYLKSEQTELANSVSYIERLALAKPEIAFTLSNNDNVLVKTTGSGNLKKTIHEIYGLNVSNKMLEINGANDDYEISGFVCKPEVLKSNRNHIITIVNGRVVRNNDINRYINDAYYTYKPDGKHPIVVINIETDPTLIDVNIHPTKQDIKLSNMVELGTLIVDTIKSTLYQTLLVPKIAIAKPVNSAKEVFIDNIVNDKSSIIEEVQETFDFSLKEEVNDSVVINQELKSLVLYPVGLVHGTYIIAENEDGMYVIDQHAAQERINYEKYFKALSEKEITKTSTLFPITVELSASEFLTIKEHMEVLTNMGFVLEEFGVNTFVFKEHPTWFREGYEEESVRKIVDLVIVSKKDFDVVKFNEHVAITLACKMSIKANMRISHEAMEEILNELVLCDNPYNCPHGRPTMINFSAYDLEKMFKRVV